MKRSTKISALIVTLAMLIGCFALGTFASGSVEPISFLEDYVVYSEYRQNDGVIGIPVGICTYVKDAKENTNNLETIVMFYVMNYNDEGTNLSNVGLVSFELTVERSWFRTASSTVYLP